MVDYGDTVLYNKAESEEDIHKGRRFAMAVGGKTVIASLKKRRVIQIIQKE